MFSRRVIGVLSLATALLCMTGPSQAEDKELDYDLGAKIRLRAFGLYNGSFVRQLDPSLKASLDATDDETIDEEQRFLDMRLRAFVTVRPSDNIRLFGQIEIGNITFGDAASGGNLGASGVNTESKNLYLEFDFPDLPLTFRGGLQPVLTRRSIILSNHAAALQLRYALDDYKTNFSLTSIKAIESSRLDLDGDGKIDNDYDDRDIYLFSIRNSSIEHTTLETYLVADIDKTQKIPTDQVTNMYWLGLGLTSRFGMIGTSIDAIYNWGRVTESSPSNRTVHTRAWAIDTRISFDLAVVELEAIFAAASGADPNDPERNDAFQTISPAYAISNILYDDFGGFSTNGSSLSGTMAAALKASGGVTDKLSLDATLLFSRLTSRPDISTNIWQRTGERNLGWEFNLNADYQLYEPLRIFAKSGVLLPGDGFRNQFDSPDDGPLLEFVLGTQLTL